MAKARIFIVDDSVVVRHVLSAVVGEHPDLELVGFATNGKDALAKIAQLKPDLVTMDVEMPIMDGLTTVKELRKINPRVPIIMLSSLTERGASTTLEALSLGASDYVTKPTTGGQEGAKEYLKEQLIPKIIGLCTRRGVISGGSSSAKSLLATSGAAPIQFKRSGSSRIDIVAIGVSTGGPSALDKLIPKLSERFPVPIVIVQHMPPIFTKSLADRLNQKSAVTVSEGYEGAELYPGSVWIAPGGQHMVVKKHGTSITLSLNQDPPENSCRPAADVLFRSVVKIYGANSLAVVLTGMGQDGLKGAQEFSKVGAAILAQDEETSVVWGMPGFIARAGIAEKVLPIEQMAPEIERKVALQRLIR